MTAKRDRTADLGGTFSEGPARQWPPTRPRSDTTKDVPPVITWLVIFACILFPTLVLLNL